MKSWLTLFILFVLVSTLGYTQVTNKLDNLQVGTLTTKTIDVTSTVKASKPCPKMTLAERNAIVGPLEGQCIYNSTAKTLNLYDGVAWVEVAGGGDGGIANWQTGTFYDVDDVVIYSGNIYQCITLHTSGASFDPSKFNILAQDLASATGSLDASRVGAGDISNTEFSYLNNASSEIQTQLNGKEPTITTLPLNKGGTNKNATASAGSVVYSDADSFELSSVGTAGQYLQSNGASAPSWSSVSVNDAGFSGVLSLGKGGTSKSLTANNGAIAYSDADSFELLAPGTSGQILQSNGAAAPSFVNKSISAKSESSAAVSLEEIQVYNDQLTQTAAGKHKIETGNKNILVNPSFEHATFSTGWTNSAGTFAEDTVVEVDGLKAASVVLSSQTLNLRQDSTLYAAQFADGIQLLGYARVKTSVSGVKLCPRKAGVTQTSLCVSHTGSGKWELLKIPFISSATSNGLVIQTDSTVSGTVYIDDAFLGAQDLKQDISNVSDWISFTPTWSSSGTQPSIGNGTIVGKYRRVGDSVEVFTEIYSGSTTTYGTGIYSFSMPSNLRIDPAKISISGDRTVLGVGALFGSRAYNTDITYNGDLSYQVSMSLHTSATTGGRISNTFPETWTNVGNINSFSLSYKYPVIGWGSSGSIYSSTNADTDWQACQFSTLAWQGLGTVTNNLECKRQGSDLLMRGVIITGTVTASTAQVLLPTWNGVQLLSSKSQTTGRLVRGNSSVNSWKDFNAILSSGLSYFTVGPVEFAAGQSPFTATNGNALFSSSETVSFENVRIPIQGWEQSNILIGQFNGLESCTDSYQCTDVFSARISNAGVVLGENIDWINGNCTIASTSQYTCTYRNGLNGSGNNLTNAMSCTVQNAQNGGSGVNFISNSSTGFTVNTFNTTNQASLAQNFNIICQKQGVDYIGKTAKAVASDQNLRTPSITNGVIYSVRFSIASGILSQHGDAFQSYTKNSTGIGTFTLKSGAFTSTPHCSIVTEIGSGDTNMYNCSFDIGAFSASQIKLGCRQIAPTGGTTYFDVQGQLVCHGVRQ